MQPANDITLDNPFNYLWLALQRYQFTTATGSLLISYYESAYVIEMAVNAYIESPPLKIEHVLLSDGTTILPLHISSNILSFLIYSPSTSELTYEEMHTRGGLEHAETKKLSDSENEELSKCGWYQLTDEIKKAYTFTLSYFHSNPKSF
ncbi:MAG: hypothetical protein SFY56_05480 [Bacteroidota bacterium]|nr:hypothetical protein [Bacteroidota bacterium]